MVKSTLKVLTLVSVASAMLVGSHAQAMVPALARTAMRGVARPGMNIAMRSLATKQPNIPLEEIVKPVIDSLRETGKAAQNVLDQWETINKQIKEFQKLYPIQQKKTITAKFIQFIRNNPQGSSK